MNKPQPSAEQLAALTLFAAANGRYWKAVLREVWINGNYASTDLNGADSAALQQLRNTLGPSWLVKFKLPASASSSATVYGNVWNYLNAEQYLAQNRKDFSRSRALVDALRLLEAAFTDRAAQWLRTEREFLARHPHLAISAAAEEAELLTYRRNVAERLARVDASIAAELAR
jgi:hypothetical protein